MTTYLERYLHGEYEQVWRELMSLGAKIRREHLDTDALAVARETMSRVHINVEMLIDKLTQIGFLFRYDHRIKPLFHGDTLVDRQRDYLDKFLWVRQQPPVFLASKHRDEEIAARDHSILLFALRLLKHPARMLFDPILVHSLPSPYGENALATRVACSASSEWLC